MLLFLSVSEDSINSLKKNVSIYKSNSKIFSVSIITINSEGLNVSYHSIFSLRGVMYRLY